ncbi:MAG: hypothetical protein ACKVOQ_08700 [Cyclobacteriaceae bacterium]
MKKILTIAFLLAQFVCYSQLQSSVDKLIQTTKAGIFQKKEITFDNSTNSLQVGEYIIPISQNTLVKVELENGKYEVEFSLQKGTTVKNTLDPNWKRASFALPFKSQQAAKNFINIFEELTERENTN